MALTADIDSEYLRFSELDPAGVLIRGRRILFGDAVPEGPGGSSTSCGRRCRKSHSRDEPRTCVAELEPRVMLAGDSGNQAQP